MELGTGKGDFISQLALLHPEINYIGIEAQQDVLYSAARKVREKELPNVKLLVFDINNIENIFAPGEVDRFYVNFCDPWPKARHDRINIARFRRLFFKKFELEQLKGFRKKKPFIFRVL